MRICIDLDGVISNLKKNNESYKDLKPIKGAVKKIKDLKKNGHYIIIYTARHMKTCDGNVGKVISKIGMLTLDWLKKYKVPYDEIYFGKPWADIYIDDNALRFLNWSKINSTGSNLPKSTEKKVKEKN
tara:strand:- start:682 stop:1065 length:384 start_codon:yes stop_codon:yes gene_type:complete